MVLTILNNRKAFCKAGKQNYKQWLELQIEFMCIFSLRGHTDENGCQQYWQDHLETQKNSFITNVGDIRINNYILGNYSLSMGASQVALVVENLPMKETQVWSLGQKDPLE